jgi:hypothetical protein
VTSDHRQYGAGAAAHIDPQTLPAPVEQLLKLPVPGFTHGHVVVPAN